VIEGVHAIASDKFHLLRKPRFDELAPVIGAIPTFLIFVFCQGVIMRGIVVPTEK